MRLVDRADVIPTMVSQDVETIRAMMKELDAGVIELVQNTVREIISKNPGARDVLLNEPEKLDAIGMNIRAVA